MTNIYIYYNYLLNLITFKNNKFIASAFKIILTQFNYELLLIELGLDFELNGGIAQFCNKEENWSKPIVCQTDNSETCQI